MCTMHETIENENGIDIYPYRCYRCGGCFLCEHKLIYPKWWVCADGTKVSTRPTPGVKV